MTSHSIILTPAAQQWAMEHGSAITLRQSPRHGCCGGAVLVPVAEPGIPRESAKYERQAVDGVTIYSQSPRATENAAPIRIDVAGIGRWQRFVVEGIDIVPDHARKG